MELFPSRPDVEPESTVRQFEKFTPVFNYFDRSELLRQQLFEPYFAQLPYSDQVGRVEVRSEDDRLLYDDLGLGVRCHEPYRQNLLQRGSYQDLLLVRRNGKRGEDYLALWQQLNFGRQGLSGFKYSILELHNSGLVDYLADSFSLKASDINKLYNGEFGPFSSELTQSEYEPKKYVVRLDRTFESQVSLRAVNEGFSRAKFTDDELIEFVGRKSNEQNQAIADLRPWLIRRYEGTTVI